MSMHSWAIRLLGAALVVNLGACHGATTPTPTPTRTPPPPPASPPTAGVTVSGTVTEFTDSGQSRRVPNLRLKVSAPGAWDGAIGGVELADVVTDADGRYTVANVSAALLFFQTAPGSEYRFLCDSYPLLVKYADRHADLPVVHSAWSGNRPPPRGVFTPGTSVYGIVSERVGGSLQPVAARSRQHRQHILDPAAATALRDFRWVEDDCLLTTDD